jgi:hypothetical protein
MLSEFAFRYGLTWQAEQDLRMAQKICGRVPEGLKGHNEIRGFVEELLQRYPITLKYIGTHTGKKEIAFEVKDRRKDFGIVEKIEDSGFIWDEVKWEDAAGKYKIEFDLDDVRGTYLTSYRYGGPNYARKTPGEKVTVLFVKAIIGGCGK